MWLSTILFFIVFAETSTWVKFDCIDEELEYLQQSSRYSKFLNQILIFQGVHNAVVGDLQTHYENQTITVNISSNRPHSFWKGKPYINVEVMDNYGIKIYERLVEGVTAPSFHEVPMQEGFQIKIFHEEAPARLLSPDGITHLGVNRTTHRFLVTRYGLMNLALGNNPLYTFLRKLYRNSGELQSDFFGSDNAKHVVIGVRSLPEPYRTEFVMKYSTILSDCAIVFITVDVGKGNIVVSSKQGLHNLIGTVVAIKSGDEVVLEDTIQPQSNLFNYVNVPFGVYSMEFRGRGAEEYIIHPQYIEVNSSVNPVLFDFIRIDDSLLFKDAPLDNQLMYITSNANAIATSAFRSRASLYVSNEKKLLLAAIRSLPGYTRGPFLNRYGGLFRRFGSEGRMRNIIRVPSRNPGERW
ncbi:uncharacterized protein LOC113230289 [Hyposmocoma kahamanoa]|uniref:uncharacterized protein LOC113230289 n=1 Tax=Hyposmocoma kahamanoa TaxID=1477025 RepID=UPI000E6D6665|nr:uncharacterized protein LOC113230289 [Hyposmocoma kahamanoa]XP_026319940.1 uncharacterized protein LOC113230289 [Hyposmocoma kahamanoa]XP_026319941.1 uncharacterized protein LOC113230289 [Hyposmocoma kahamanoa]XP_026319942.1 uncharacterized protein LOC113230289 [Hyposmocoma kahamanoa]XP_026319943.1 uncharacterized protein LOC113230289 [Hyposmocoma kahamanoa]